MNISIGAGNEFTAVYSGRDTVIAEKYLDAGNCCAIVFCKTGYGVAILSGERAEIIPEKCIAAVLRGNSQGITLSSDFSGYFFICSGELPDGLFRYYLGEHPFRVTEGTYNEKQAVTPSLYELHGMLNRLFAEKRRGDRSKPASVEVIKEYIDTHTDKKITLDELSKRFFISKTQIFRLFTREYNIPPMKYMLHKKIEVSKELLLATDMRISEIAEALSFTDAKHYTKTFRAFTGMLPREFRQRCQPADKRR